MQSEEYQKLWQKRLPKSKRIDDLEAALGYTFQDRAYLYEALTHRSAIATTPARSKLRGEGAPASAQKGATLSDWGSLWNERLEFLGDAVLGLAIGSRLIERSEDFAEGELSKIRAALVNETYLAQLARRIDLGSYLLLGRGEELAGGRDKPSMLADAVEALLGAVFRDGGFDKAKAVVARLYDAELGGALGELTGRDFKSELQELVQARLKARPTYDVVEEGGPGHARHFEVAVRIAGREWGRGKGASKKRASQEAAHMALAQLQGAGPSWDLSTEKEKPADKLTAAEGNSQ